MREDEPMSESVRLLIADEHSLFLEALKVALDDEPELRGRG
jgi:hypothetical protein